MRLSTIVLATVVVFSAAAAPAPARPYHLELEATPEAAFPWLGRFGKVDLHVYPAGVRAEALWLHGFSRTGTSAVTVVNPLGRMYLDMPIADVPGMLQRLAGDRRGVEAGARPKAGPTMKGTVKGVAATRHRLMFGKSAWVDVWTTAVIPRNEQMRLLVKSVVGGISPGTAEAAAKLPGTPIYVELNFRRFKKVPLVRLKKLTFDDEGQEDALTLGKLYVRAAVLEKLLTK